MRIDALIFIKQLFDKIVAGISATIYRIGDRYQANYIIAFCDNCARFQVLKCLKS
jgi:hypothetical protein